MNNSTEAIIIAAVGVLGTLGAAAIGQLLSARARRNDFDMQRSQRQEDRDLQKQEAELASKRACYIALLASSRTYRIELLNNLRRIRRKTIDNAARDNLHEILQTWLANLSEVQIVGSLQVLSSIDPVNAGLSKAYLAIRRLEAGEPEPDESFEEINRLLEDLWDKWHYMREEMRRDLGISD